MKKIFLLLAASVVSAAAFSQVKWGFQATGNVGSASIPADDGVMYHKSPRLGAGIGVVADIFLGDVMSFRPSLNFIQKGMKTRATETFGTGLIEVSLSTRLNYLELPMNLTYNVPIANGKVFFGAGPSVGYGISGKAKAESSISGMPDMEDGYISDERDAFKKVEDGGAGFKRFDVGATAIAGLQLNSGLFVNAGYLHSFSNALEDSDDGKYKSRGFTLTLGILLGK